MPVEGPAGIWDVPSSKEMAVLSSVCETEGLWEAELPWLVVNTIPGWPLPCPVFPMSSLTSATGTPSGGRHCRRTSWSRGTSLPRGS